MESRTAIMADFGNHMKVSLGGTILTAQPKGASMPSQMGELYVIFQAGRLFKSAASDNPSQDVVLTLETLLRKLDWGVDGIIWNMVL